MDCKPGRTYHAIRRLAKSGLIHAEKTGREGRRPERTTYRITPAGARAFIEVLRKIVATPKREASECMRPSASWSISNLGKPERS